MPRAREQGQPSSTAAERVWRKMQAMVLDNERRKEVSEALDMSFVRAKALRRLAEGPVTLRQLASMLLTDAPYTTIVVDDLEARALVVRRAHPEDHRAKLVELTPAGRHAVEVAQSILDRPPKGLQDLSADDLATLERILLVALP